MLFVIAIIISGRQNAVTLIRLEGLFLNLKEMKVSWQHFWNINRNKLVNVRLLEYDWQIKTSQSQHNKHEKHKEAVLYFGQIYGIASSVESISEVSSEM